MSEIEQPWRTPEIHEQIAIWRRQANSIPGLIGGKSVWVPLLLELVSQLGNAAVLDLDSTPVIPAEVFLSEPGAGGAAPPEVPATWRQYYAFLRGVGLAERTAQGIVLTSVGLELLADPTPARMGIVLADRVRLFAETLAMIANEPMTVDEVHKRVQGQYRPSWKGLGNTRSRLDWQEKLGLIEPVGSREWTISDTGRALLADRALVTPEAFESKTDVAVDLAAAPAEISTLLDELRDSVRDHEERSTYNIWAPSPPTKPNKVENLRIIINEALTRIERSELFAFICETFDLKRSSVESMMPFMRASGLLLEVGRGIYEATPTARAWIESGDDINFVRILHAHMRYVGEMISAVEPDVTRNEMYAIGKAYGLNVEKCRWIASFLLDTGLIEEPRYGSLRATATGVALLPELPLADVPSPEHGAAKQEKELEVMVPAQPSMKMSLVKLAKEPHSSGAKPGRAFEYSVRDAFRLMGFDARVISGSGDTDVLVQWQEDDGTLAAAVVEAKARSNGHVSHTDVSDVALETHKRRNNAAFVAVVGPAFSGDTIRNMAEQKLWSLVEAERLGSIVEAVVSLGLRPREAALLFKSPNGMSELDDLIAERYRELEIVSFIFTKLDEESEESGEAISARDISRDGRKTELAPSATEVVTGMDLISRLQFHALNLVDDSERPEYVTYELGDVKASVRRLRALADAIERRSFEP